MTSTNEVPPVTPMRAYSLSVIGSVHPQISLPAGLEHNIPIKCKDWFILLKFYDISWYLSGQIELRHAFDNSDSVLVPDSFMLPTWGPPGSRRPQVGPMLAPWTLLSGVIAKGRSQNTFSSSNFVVNTVSADGLVNCLKFTHILQGYFMELRKSHEEEFHLSAIYLSLEKR